MWCTCLVLTSGWQDVDIQVVNVSTSKSSSTTCRVLSTWISIGKRRQESNCQMEAEPLTCLCPVKGWQFVNLLTWGQFHHHFMSSFCTGRFTLIYLLHNELQNKIWEIREFFLLSLKSFKSMYLFRSSYVWYIVPSLCISDHFQVDFVMDPLP